MSSKPILCHQVRCQFYLLYILVHPPNALHHKVDVIPISVAKVAKSPNVFPASNIFFVLHSTSAFCKSHIIPNVPTVCNAPNVPAVCPVTKLIQYF